ncbi:Uncharacterised protein [Mycobacteroides abscessus subsp. abscessus]|uniref:hypothetical protein n=1 Tax=Mycobacteroides abscessus TaxID=36809 RepID=UPI0005B3F609|nr:hypothetical protein [Mycobacteroides abscessus]QSM03852.1 membrane protein [Mycobacterium phage prophiGD05-3]MDM2350592.1 hypothetical protein [Mycobacteroides abscessus]MDM2357851.1 hypothetical protein [Mycobacteroides abscessus]QSN50866.1 hypothetical protein I3U39_18950 [Mycobacteroides abscessus subsp. abscessus]SHU93909.1 Uncharacterised protein [Mycobacteroides abscessus subsp. abscessus]
MTPEIIQAVGAAVAAILTAWQALTSRKVRDLEARIRAVELERDTFRTKLKAAVRHIREWMGWAMHHAPGQAPPALPSELRDEI